MLNLKGLPRAGAAPAAAAPPPVAAPPAAAAAKPGVVKKPGVGKPASSGAAKESGDKKKVVKGGKDDPKKSALPEEADLSVNKRNSIQSLNCSNCSIYLFK